MIKRFRVSLIDKEIVLHVGPESWDKYVRESKAKGRVSDPDEDESIIPEEGSGRAWGSWIWVHDIKDLNTVLHEVLHFLDDTYAYVNCTKEPEFKAYIGAELLEKVIVWREKELKK